jgi:hypothetical protein
MQPRALRLFLALELEEKILNIGALVALLGVLCPWLGGEWLGGEEVSYSGFGFFTSFLGVAVFLLLLFVLCLTVLPLFNGPNLVKRRHREVIRLVALSQATVLILSALSVLTSITLEFSRMEVRFGIYLSLVGSLVAVLYAFLRYQEERKHKTHPHYAHPEQVAVPSEEPEAPAIIHAPVPPPPPPPAMEPEEHRLYP